MNVLSSTSLPRHVALLVYGGLLPFIGLALLIPISPEKKLLCTAALVNYGAVILSFTGALHWGFAMAVRDMSVEQRRDRLVWSVMPALFAWVATLLIAPLGFLLLIGGFVIHYWQDRQLFRVMNLPDWYLPMRLRLTIVVSICLLFGTIFLIKS